MSESVDLEIRRTLREIAEIIRRHPLVWERTRKYLRGELQGRKSPACNEPSGK